MLKAFAAVLATFALLWAVLFILGNYTEFGREDACMDAGGVWNSAQTRCEGARPPYKDP
jgi:hypothetical protein